MGVTTPTTFLTGLLFQGAESLKIQYLFFPGPVMLDEFVEWLKAARAKSDIS